MSERHAIKDKSHDRRYFNMVPRYVKVMCRSPYDFSLWDTIREVAGEEGECFLSTEDLAILSMMSVGQVVDSRTFLLGAGLLIGEVRRDPGFNQPTWHLAIPDLWAKNLAWCERNEKLRDRIEWKKAQQESLHTVKARRKPSRGEREASHSEGSPVREPSPHEVKNNHKTPIEPTEEPGGQDANFAPSASSLDHAILIAADHNISTAARVRARLEKADSIIEEDGVIRIVGLPQEDADWIDSRWTQPIERALVGVCNRRVRLVLEVAADVQADA